MKIKNLLLTTTLALGATGTIFAADTTSSGASPSFLDQLHGHAPEAITGNPAAVDAMPGTGLAGKLLHIPEWTGLRIGGVWLADTNGLLSGGQQPGKWSWNSVLIVGANLDAETLLGWKGASFGIQFLQFDGQNTNGQAGSVQGYNSLPGPDPLHRSELYQLWYRQSLFDDLITFRIGKQVPTFDFNNVARPVSTHDEGLEIPAVTGLLFTPVFVQPNLLGAIGGYYNSVSGIAVTLAPTKNTYLKYGVYDGNVARGVQTGLEGPSFNGYFFNIWEAGMDWIIADKYPGTFGAGLWYQSGVFHYGPNNSNSQNGYGGFYMFGSQRIWSNHGPTEPADGGKVCDGGKVRDGKTATGKNKIVVEPQPIQKSSISAFFQYGVNNSETMPMNQSFGLGLTGFGLVPHRPKDSIGAGMSWAWLNPNIFDRSSELMFQTYYQAHLFGGTFFQPTVSYIPTPGGSSGHGDVGGAWALSFRLTMLF